MQYELLDKTGKSKTEEPRVENIRMRTLETDAVMLRQELAETNVQRSASQTEVERLKSALRHVKEEAVKEVEKARFPV